MANYQYEKYAQVIYPRQSPHVKAKLGRQEELFKLYTYGVPFGMGVQTGDLVEVERLGSRVHAYVVRISQYPPYSGTVKPVLRYAGRGRTEPAPQLDPLRAIEGVLESMVRQAVREALTGLTVTLR